MEVFPVRINSNLVSAQNRDRWYWSNIRTKDVGLFAELWTDIPQPKDRGILLKDILENNDLLNKGIIIGRRLNSSGHREDYNKNIKITQCLEVRKSNSKSNCLTTVEKDNVITNIEIGRHPDVYNKSKKLFNVNPSGNGMNGWVYDPDFKSPTLTTNKGEGSKIAVATIDKSMALLGSYAKKNIWDWERKRNGGTMVFIGNNFNDVNIQPLDKKEWRKLTPIECERLQTIPDNYTEGVSNTQRYKMIGNGWTVDVIAHIFKGLL
jgi:DNA (cytosine-5)-methyltransferase 3A